MKTRHLIFRQLQKKDFSKVRRLAYFGWLFAYKHLPKKELKKLVKKYYANENLQKSVHAISKGTDSFLLAFRQNTLIGFCHVTIKSKQASEMRRLYINPKLIGKGIGKELLQRSENFLQEKNCKTIFTFVNKHNKIGLHFYLRNGFKHKSSKDKDNEFEPKVVWYMEKKLTVKK